MDIVNLSAEPLGKLHSWIPQGVVAWAAANRAAIEKAIAQVSGDLEVILDLPHNTYEMRPNGEAIIRKGSVHLSPGGLSILPSHRSGDVALIRATERIGEILNSTSHGTGRKMCRGDCKPLAEQFDFARLRQSAMIPSGVEDTSFRTEGPYAYRDLDECLGLLRGFVEEAARFAAVGYMGHLG